MDLFVGVNIVKHLAMKAVHYPEETVSRQFERYVARFPSIRLSVIYSVSAKSRYKRSAGDSMWKSKRRKRNDIFSSRVSLFLIRDRRRRQSVGCTSSTLRKLILVDYDSNRTTPDNRRFLVVGSTSTRLRHLTVSEERFRVDSRGAVESSKYRKTEDLFGLENRFFHRPEKSSSALSAGSSLIGNYRYSRINKRVSDHRYPGRWSDYAEDNRDRAEKFVVCGCCTKANKAKDRVDVQDGSILLAPGND